MGIFDRLTGEAQRNFIARSDEAKADIVYKYPENNVRTLTQLTVDADEVCIFVKEGKVAGKLGPGRHSLDTNNIPFLSALLEKVTGGNLFTAELYFISMREFAGNKFGGPVGDVRDPETGLGIGTMVYGDFSLRVTEPEKLIFSLVGLRRADNQEFLNWFKSQLLKVVRDRIAELLVKKRWALLDVTSGAYTEELEQEIVAGVRPHVETYGVQIVRLGNFHVSVKEEDEHTLKKLGKDVAYSKLAGGFQNYAQGQAMLGAAEGMAKGGGEGSAGAMQGMGMGMGFGMANAFAQQQQQGRPAAPPVAVPMGGTAACPKCGAQGNGKFCSSCGTPFAVAAPTCPSCSADVSPGAKFCATCGKPITA